MRDMDSSPSVFPVYIESFHIGSLVQFDTYTYINETTHLSNDKFWEWCFDNQNILFPIVISWIKVINE